MSAALASLQATSACSVQGSRRQAPSSAYLVPNALRLTAQAQGPAARQLTAQQRRSLRVKATQAPPAHQAGAGTAVADDSGVFDAVVVGAGISGLTTAQVRAPACCLLCTGIVPAAHIDSTIKCWTESTRLHSSCPAAYRALRPST